MNFALLWKMKTETTSVRHIMEELVKNPYVAFPGRKPFEIAVYLSEAEAQLCYILSLWQNQQELEKALTLFKPGSFYPKFPDLQLVSQSQFQLTWEYCILPRTVESSYLCLFSAPTDLTASRFEEMKNNHRAYIKQVSGLNRVWTGQALDTSRYITLFRADWNGLQAQTDFLNANNMAQQKRQVYQTEGFEVEYALCHLFDFSQTEEKPKTMPLRYN